MKFYKKSTIINSIKSEGQKERLNKTKGVFVLYKFSKENFNDPINSITKSHSEILKPFTDSQKSRFWIKSTYTKVLIK